MSINTEYVGIVKLSNCYAAMRFQGDKKQFISKCLEEDIKTARVTAQLFAQLNNLPFDNKTIYAPIKPILTIFKEDSKWYPCEIYAEGIKLITHFGKEDVASMDTGGNKEQAMNWAKLIAKTEHLTFMPSIGISFCEKQTASPSV